MLEMRHISKVYRTDTVETHALRDFSLRVDEGEFVAVTGPSGSGKTTFLNIAGLLEESTAGSYLLDGHDVSSLSDDARSDFRNEKIGFIFQSFNLIPDLDVFDNVDVPLRYRGFNRAERKQRIESALERVGLTSRIRHLPSQLSGAAAALPIAPAVTAAELVAAAAPDRTPAIAASRSSSSGYCPLSHGRFPRCHSSSCAMDGLTRAGEALACEMACIRHAHSTVHS